MLSMCACVSLMPFLSIGFVLLCVVCLQTSGSKVLSGIVREKILCKLENAGNPETELLHLFQEIDANGNNTLRYLVVWCDIETLLMCVVWFMILMVM